jgi:hypothetical protein
MKNILVILIICFVADYGFSQKNKPAEKTNIISTPATVTYKRKTPAQPPETAKPTQSVPEEQTLDLPSSKPFPAGNKTSSGSKSTNKLDTIIRLGGKKIGCNVHKINPTSVSYSKPEQSAVLEMPRKEIEKIMFRNGRKEVFNKPVLQMIDNTQWEAVLVTENPNDVEGLYKKGFIKATASSDSRSPKAAKTSATIRLQKKAANLGALIVLITSSEMKGGYGEIPGCELQGIAYSDTPPADTASVNKLIRQMLDRNKARIEGAKKKKG